MTFDLHLAGGLRLWPVLLLFAWSSVGFNLPQVYNPVLAVVPGPALPTEQPAEPLLGEPDWSAARRAAETHLAAAEIRKVFALSRIAWLRLDREKRLWIAAFWSDRVIQKRFAGGRMGLSAHDGSLRYLTLPTGHSGRETFESWLNGLHMGLCWAPPGGLR